MERMPGLASSQDRVEETLYGQQMRNGSAEGFAFFTEVFLSFGWAKTLSKALERMVEIEQVFRVHILNITLLVKQYNCFCFTHQIINSIPGIFL
ncbi:hypothetical protein ACNQGH_11865 [Flavobacterium sp. ZS1P14]